MNILQISSSSALLFSSLTSGNLPRMNGTFSCKQAHAWMPDVCLQALGRESIGCMTFFAAQSTARTYDFEVDSLSLFLIAHLYPFQAGDVAHVPASYGGPGFTLLVHCHCSNRVLQSRKLHCFGAILEIVVELVLEVWETPKTICSFDCPYFHSFSSHFRVLNLQATVSEFECLILAMPSQSEHQHTADVCYVGCVIKDS